jgi:hypothetical protein
MLGTRTSKQHKVYTVATDDDFFKDPILFYEILTALNINDYGFPGFHIMLYGR